MQCTIIPRLCDKYDFVSAMRTAVHGWLIAALESAELPMDGLHMLLGVADMFDCKDELCAVGKRMVSEFTKDIQDYGCEESGEYEFLSECECDEKSGRSVWAISKRPRQFL